LNDQVTPLPNGPGYGVSHRRLGRAVFVPRKPSHSPGQGGMDGWFRHALQATAPAGLELEHDGAMRLRIFTEPQQGASYDQLLAVARCAEEEGFDAFFRSDHYLKIGERDGHPGPTDSWATLAGLARETSRLRLGTMVTSATFRLPGPLAVAVAQVDAMSGGRVEFGLGSGWYEAEHKAYGIPFPSTGERFQRLEEQLAIITGLWDTPDGRTFDYRGRHYQLEGSPALPKPVQRPHPPVIIGGAGATRTPRLAARFADEYNTPFLRPEAAGLQYRRVRDACEAASRDPTTMRYSFAVTTCCGADAAEISRRAQAIGRQEADLRMNGACGTPVELIERLSQWADAGAEVAYLQIMDVTDLDHLRLIARDVLPALRD
jgi:F420-dependent oxidoreductase-like protein